MAEKIISFGVTLEEYRNLDVEARNASMSISMFCKSRVLRTVFNEYYQVLLERVNELPANRNLRFAISDLFENEEWRIIPKGIRLSIGKQFYIGVQNNIIQNVHIEGFGTSKTMRYSKI
jgi:hypothetical protein